MQAAKAGNGKVREDDVERRVEVSKELFLGFHANALRFKTSAAQLECEQMDIVLLVFQE